VALRPFKLLLDGRTLHWGQRIFFLYLSEEITCDHSEVGRGGKWSKNLGQRESYKKRKGSPKVNLLQLQKMKEALTPF